MPQLTNRVVVVTGGAAGMGAAMVRRFAVEGAAVIFTDVQQEQGHALAVQTGAQFVQADVSDEDSWVRLFADVHRTHGRLDALVNNAGVVPVDNIEDVEIGALRRTFAVNVEGPLFGCKHAIATMRRNPGGSSGAIVNVVSTGATFGIAGQLSYCSSKGALRLMTKSVALHCARARLNIRCNAILPGGTHTSLVDRLLEQAPDPRQLLAHMNNIAPVGRMAQPDDIAAMALFLISDESAYLTGADFVVDGGMSANHPGL